MGLFAALAALVVIAVIIIGFMGRTRPKGRVDEPRPVSFTQPAADEPTPAASRTAPREVADHAQRRTPPA